MSTNEWKPTKETSNREHIRNITRKKEDEEETTKQEKNTSEEEEVQNHSLKTKIWRWKSQ